MRKSFNSKLMFDNIAFLVKESGRKIGELEAESGVSAGYISRTSKDGGAKPGIDFVVKVADALGVSIDVLLNINLSELSPTERYLLSFLDKLRRNTLDFKLDWEPASADQLNNMKPGHTGYVNHPLFSVQSSMEKTEDGCPKQVRHAVMISNSFGINTVINGSCYGLSMKNDAYLYLMDVRKSTCDVHDPKAYAKEVWLCPSYNPSQFLCSTLEGAALAEPINSLFDAVAEYSKHPRLKYEIRNILDAFLADDLDDNDTELPF